MLLARLRAPAYFLGITLNRQAALHLPD